MLTIEPSRLRLRMGSRVLDLGCGEGRHALGLATICSAAEIIALDINHKDLATAVQRKRGLPMASPCFFTQGNGAMLPFADNSFDVVICSEVLEHIKNYQSFVNEIRRVLKPLGQLAMSVPRFWPEKICWWLEKNYHNVPGGHLRIFREHSLRRELITAGFIFEYRHWAHALHAPYWWLRCLFWKKGEKYWLTSYYHRLLVWDLMRKPWITQTLEQALNPVMGKSVVLYFKKTKLSQEKPSN